MKLVVHELEIDAPPSTVFRYLTDPARFVLWMADSAVLDASPGGTVRWAHANGDVVSGQFIELVADRRVVFSYGWERAEVEIPPGSTTVTIELEPVGVDRTRLRLTHDGLDDLAADAHHDGWQHYLERLRVAATAGVVGPDPFADRRVPTPMELRQ